MADVIVTENLFSDIITDLAAIIQGSLGIAADGNINPEGVSMFEPMGGSAPKYTGQNVINPLTIICAGGMMMDALGEPEIARAVFPSRVPTRQCGEAADAQPGSGLFTPAAGEDRRRRTGSPVGESKS